MDIAGFLPPEFWEALYKAAAFWCGLGEREKWTAGFAVFAALFLALFAFFGKDNLTLALVGGAVSTFMLAAGMDAAAAARDIACGVRLL